MAERARIIRRVELHEMRTSEMIVLNAQAEANAILTQARAQASQLKSDILELAEKEAIQNAKEILSNAETTAQTQLDALEQEVSNLVAQTVAKVIGDIDQATAVKAATKTALAALTTNTRAKIRSAPKVFRAVTDAVAETKASGREVVDRVTQDESLTGDRVILSSDQGHVEIGLTEQIDAVTGPWRNNHE